MGTLRTPDGGASDWFNILGGDGFQCEVDPIDGQRVYCESQNGAIHRSTDGGNSFSVAVQGIANADRNNWNTPITHDPRTTQRLYTATDRVYRSINGAGNWDAISGDLTDGPSATLAAAPSGPVAGRDHLANVTEGTVTTVAASALDINVVWAGTDDGHVWVTQNGGSSWTQVDVPGRTEWVTRVETDPFSAAGAYVTFSGYHYGSRSSRIFRTTNFGASWADIGGSLPDVPLNGVNADPAPSMRGRLYVCSDAGVYVTDNYGASWSALGSGLPPVVVLDLDLIDTTRQLFAGTHGRSMYLYELGQLGPADADGDGSDNLADCRPEDPSVFSAPGEVAGLSFGADRVTLSWSPAQPSAGSSTLHQVLRGSVADLPVGAPSEACLVSGTAGASVSDPVLPADGTAFWYLVRAINACGTGTYGAAGNGTPRAGTACP
jgi:hypothetical protein